ncbi:uncharacterized protein BX664DRAFT_322067, partial [Halteromyces radiatus]|uniref:uncharacterized protein n=1 Tax=Halteromyces radiatus TaxID=101107 RepID=UPI0022203D16
MDSSFGSQDDLALYTTDVLGDVAMEEVELKKEDQVDNENNNDDPDDDCNHGLTFDKHAFSFLPQVHSIVQSILNGDNSDEIGKAVVRLNDRIDQARLLLQDLPGLQYGKEEQETILRQETSLLQQKKSQLAKYSTLNAFTNNN